MRVAGVAFVDPAVDFGLELRVVGQGRGVVEGAVFVVEVDVVFAVHAGGLVVAEGEGEVCAAEVGLDAGAAAGVEVGAGDVGGGGGCCGEQDDEGGVHFALVW